MRGAPLSVGTIETRTVSALVNCMPIRRGLRRRDCRAELPALLLGARSGLLALRIALCVCLLARLTAFTTWRLNQSSIYFCLLDLSRDTGPRRQCGRAQTGRHVARECAPPLALSARECSDLWRRRTHSHSCLSRCHHHFLTIAIN